MRWLPLALVLACSESPAPTAKPAPVKQAAPVSVELNSGWVRAKPAGPHPAARGLYRRIVTLRNQGKPVEPIRKQIRETWPDSRYAHRLEPGASPAAVAAAIGLIAALVVAGASP